MFGFIRNQFKWYNSLSEEEGSRGSLGNSGHTMSYQLLDIRMHNQLRIEQTWSIVKQTHLFARKGKKVVVMGNFVNH